MALAKTGGYEITKDEAEAYMAELADCELDGEVLSKAAGGICRTDCPKAGDCIKETTIQAIHGLGRCFFK